MKIHLTVKDGFLRADEIRKDGSNGLNLYHYPADAFPNDTSRMAAVVDRLMFDLQGQELTFVTESEYRQSLDVVVDAVRKGKVLITL